MGGAGSFSRDWHFWTFLWIPSRELTYPPKNGIFEDDFPFPKVGYVSSLEGSLKKQNSKIQGVEQHQPSFSGNQFNYYPLHLRN